MLKRNRRKDIIVEQDKTQLLYTTSSFMQQESWDRYNVYLSKKTKFTFSTVIKDNISEKILPVPYIC